MDRFTFSAKKSEKLLLEVQSASLGFSLDARLKVEDAKGKELISSTMDNGVPQGFRKLVIESTDQLWLTVVPALAKAAAVAKQD